MKKVIGFATQYYTLWDYSTEPTYVTDSYGNHHQSGINHNYYYIKNISIDINKVTERYPNVPINEDLRGKERSFRRYQSNEDNLSDEYFWKGKYFGVKVEDIINNDLQYCIWFAKEFSNGTSETIKNHPTYIAHFEAIERVKQEKIDNAPTVKVGDIVEIDFIRNGYNCNGETCWTEARYFDTILHIECDYFREIDGMYPYIMPGINGTPKRVKNKTIKVTVTEVTQTRLENKYGNEYVVQYIKVL